MAEWLCSKFNGRHSALALPQFAGETGTWKSRGDLSHQRGSLGDEQCFPARTQTAARGFQQQLPAIRSKPEYGRGPGAWNAHGQSNKRHLSRQISTFGSDSPHCAVTGNSTIPLSTRLSTHTVETASRSAHPRAACALDRFLKNCIRGRQTTRTLST